MISPLADKVILTPYHHDGHGSNGTITRVVIHGTVSPCVVGGAENNARYFQSASAGGAAHYVVDPETIVACVDEDQKAAHAPPNAGSIGIELCDPQTGDGARWNDDAHRKMLELAAKLTADICARYNLPLVWRSPDQLRAGNAGITSHANVAQAWHQSDHTDPGPDFDSDAFIASLTPPSPQPGVDDMATATVTTDDGHLHIFGTKDDHLYEDVYDGTQWQQYDLGATNPGAHGLSAAKGAGSRVDLVYVDGSGQMHQGFYDGAAWQWTGQPPGNWD